MWRVILGRLHTHLEQHYSIVLPEEFRFSDSMTVNRLDAILAFKSDPYLDELRGALERLEMGTFGICLGCKEQIPDLQMDLDPLRRLCASCERTFGRVSMKYKGVAVPA